jgi:hypothetical protein
MKNGKMRGIILLAAVFCALSAQAQTARQWVARVSGTIKTGLNAPVALATDDSGNVYMTGWVTRAISGTDIVTIKYSPDGEQRWASYYQGSGSSVDKPTAIAVDSGYSVYITGTTGTGASSDYVTIKYNSAGDSLWTRRYDGPGAGEDHPVAIAVNDSLNLYVTGWSKGAGTGFDYATLRYNSDGSLAWAARYNGALNGSDSASAMALRGTSDLYVTGSSVDSGFDYLTIKYNPVTGDTVWTQRFNGVGMGNDYARAIVLRSTNEVYVTGSGQNAAGNYDYLTLRYSAAGVLQWSSWYDGTAGGNDQATGLGLYSSSRVYVTGSSLQPGSFNDIVTVALNQGSGNFIESASYNGPGNDDDAPTGIAGGTNISVCGASPGAGTVKDFVLLQYHGSNANVVQTLRFNGTANLDDAPAAVLPAGNGIIISGTSTKIKGSEIVTIKYVDQSEVKYRTFTQADYALKSAVVKTGGIPNAGNVRDAAFTLAFPKIKRGFAWYPGGLVVGNPRPDSATTFGWIRFDKGSGVAGFLPDTGHARAFDYYGITVFAGEKKNPKKDRHDNHLAGELTTLLVNIGASDAEITPPTLGDLSFNDGDTSNHYNGQTLRSIATVANNYLTYGKRYPPISWAQLDSTITRINRAFAGPLKIVSRDPVVVTGVNPVDSVTFLQAAIAPLAEPLAFEKNSILQPADGYALRQNYPNPFNPTTTIGFDLPQDAIVTLRIYNILGQEVANLLDREPMSAGAEQMQFSAQNLPTGVYFYRIVAEGVDDDGNTTGSMFQKVMKMMLVK